MQLLNGDCLELMKTLPDKSIDLFICDLPYGCLSGGAGKEKAKRKEKETEGVIAGCSWDIKIDLTQFWIQVKRLMKNDHTPIIHFCNARFGFELYNSNPDWFRYDLVWNKMRGVSFLSANKMPMKSHENIYVFSKKGSNYYRKDIEGREPYFKKSKEKVCDNYNVKRVEGENTGTRCILSVIDQLNKSGHKGGQHPTQKPLDLYKFLIERYSKEGDTVLDPTAGSFTSGLACRELNRNYIGIEMDKTFFEKGNERLKSI